MSHVGLWRMSNWWFGMIRDDQGFGVGEVVISGFEEDSGFEVGKNVRFMVWDHIRFGVGEDVGLEVVMDVVLGPGS